MAFSLIKVRKYNIDVRIFKKKNLKMALHCNNRVFRFEWFHDQLFNKSWAKEPNDHYFHTRHNVISWNDWNEEIFYKRDFWVTIPHNLLTKRQKYAIDSPLKLKQRNVMYSFSYYLFKAAFWGGWFSIQANYLLKVYSFIYWEPSPFKDRNIQSE